MSNVPEPREIETASGGPGVPPSWTSSRKSGVGTAVEAASPIWFTVAHGIVNEIYFPTMDHANTRDIGFLVAADPDFFSEEKRHTHHEARPIEQGVPGYELVNTCEAGRYRILKTVITDPRRALLLMRVKFEPLRGELRDFRLYALISPHVANQGAENDGWLGDWKREKLMFAGRAGVVLAVGCSAGWKARSCGYVGTSDGWQQVKEHRRLVELARKAPQGNVALTGEIDLAACGGDFVVAIGFGADADGAAHHVLAGLFGNFETTRQLYIEQWHAFQKTCLPLAAPFREAFDVYRVSTAVLRTHMSKQFPGAIIASLSVPWGECRGDHDLGGYHVVWARDMMHASIAMLAVGQPSIARDNLFYLMCTQEADGSWPQTMWVDGAPGRTAEQADQTAACLLVADALRRERQLGAIDPWPSIRRAAEYLIRRGPITQQDRWEENEGYTPYTLATMIAGLLAAATFADDRHDGEFAKRCRDAADDWNASIERWLYITDTELSRRCGVEGYYVRLAPAPTKSPDDLRRLDVCLKNYPNGGGCFRAADVVSPDALALVRFGLRRADDPRIRNTVAVIDATLRRETKSGPVWRRFTHDAYGEPANGDPFVGHGIGRGWPLLTGERAHYELARGKREEALRLMHALVAMSHQGGLLSEQIWDGDDIPGKSLFNGQPSGSAMPLVWAHAEFVTLLRSLRDNRVFDCPPQTQERYAPQHPA